MARSMKEVHTINYYPINEGAARRAKEMNSFSDYKEGSATAEYRAMVDKAAAVLIQSIATDGDPIGAIWGCVGYTVLLCFTLFKTGSLAKSIFGCH